VAWLWSPTGAAYQLRRLCDPSRIADRLVALALIPEAIAFSIIAGVDPNVGLYASFCIAVVIARAVRDHDIDILIMGAYSHSPLRSLFLGSKTSDLLRSAGIPTLLLR
jgi:nucleotide-binding universal stress UspA family protein